MSQQKLMFKGGALTLGAAATAAGVIGVINGWSQKCTGTSEADNVAKGARDFGLAFNGIQLGLAGMWTLGILWLFLSAKKDKLPVTNTVRFYVTAAIITGLVIFTLLTTNVRAEEVDQSCKPSETMATATTMTSIAAFAGAVLIAVDGVWK